jgi:hypothetical protein
MKLLLIFIALSFSIPSFANQSTEFTFETDAVAKMEHGICHLDNFKYCQDNLLLSLELVTQLTTSRYQRVWKIHLERERSC